ncbi:hypothetical protein HYW21_00885 [Candidatus Woesearchaeota archaeon]|nr:hypothetical protein [Candidatus Woesearchaeota archaeon]
MKKVLLFTIFFVFVLSLSNLVYACPSIRNFVVLNCDIADLLLQQNATCLNGNCSVNISKEQHGEFYDLNLQDSLEQSLCINETYGIQFYPKYDLFVKTSSFEDSIELQILQSLDSICVEDIDDMNQVFFREIQNWLSTQKASPLRGNLIFEPYSLEREFESIKSKKSYGDCYYEEYKRAGDWLIITEIGRDYCYLTGGGETRPPYATKSHLQFIEFILKNPSIYTLQYLFGYVIVLGVVMGFIIYLFKQRELKLFFKPNEFNVIVTLVLGIPLLALFILMILSTPHVLIILIIYFVSFVIGCYVFSSLLRYVYIKTKKK